MYYGAEWDAEDNGNTYGQGRTSEYKPLYSLVIPKEILILRLKNHTIPNLINNIFKRAKCKT